jgi:hypothetical protein
MPIGMPGCPDFACCTESMDRNRMAFAISIGATSEPASVLAMSGFAAVIDRSPQVAGRRQFALGVPMESTKAYPTGLIRDHRLRRQSGIRENRGYFLFVDIISLMEQ